MTGTIMVGVDGVAAHRGAIAWAAARAAREEARLELVCVIERPWGADETSTQPLVSAAEELLLQERRRAERLTDDVATRFAFGRVAAALASVSEEADLLVVGSRPVSDRDRSFAGSLAVRVAATASCPVAVVPHDWRDAGEGVVVGVDGEPSSEVAIDLAADEAAALGETLRVVCAGYSANPLLAGFVPEISLGDHRQRIADAAAVGARERRPDLDIVAEVREAAPARGLVEAAHGARLLVVGTNNRHGVKRLMLGSVSHDVLLNIRVPVLVARSRPEEQDA